ncbi:MAG: AAC(3) family N-acetyltransferase [Armatimonadota bacterium]
MHSQSDLIAAFRTVGLREGDLVVVHSSLRRLGPVEGGADGVIDALLATIGPTGTLALPTFTYATVGDQQPVWHQTLTPSSAIGALPNVFLKRKGVVRSIHPSHSVAALGPKAAELVTGHENDDSPCSRTSPFGKLADWGGKILIIGVGLQCCTFFHGCEEWADLSWMLSERSQRYCLTADGRTIPVLARGHMKNSWDQYPRIEEPLKQAGILTIGQLGDCPLHLLDAHRAADWVVAALRENPYLFLKEEEIPAESQLSEP